VIFTAKSSPAAIGNINTLPILERQNYSDFTVKIKCLLSVLKIAPVILLYHL
jgi:hypothetical protein